MPEVMVYLAAGRTPEQKEALMRGMSEVVVKTIGSDISAITVQIIEAPLTDKMKGGQTMVERWKDNPGFGAKGPKKPGA